MHVTVLIPSPFSTVTEVNNEKKVALARHGTPSDHTEFRDEKTSGCIVGWMNE